MKKIFTLFTMLCVVVGLHAETTFELSPATYKSADSQEEVVEKDGEQVTIIHYTWNFSSKSKDFTINCDKEWATGSGNTAGTMKLSRNHDFTVGLPSGVNVTAIKVTGWTNVDNADKGDKATIQINGVDDANELPYRTEGAAGEFTIDLATPITGSFKLRINNSQAAIKVYLISDYTEDTPVVNYNAEATYTVTEGEVFTSGQEVEVKDNKGNVVATVVYGESEGADFAEAKADGTVSGYTAFSPGNGVNGDKPGGTFYTIKPLYNGEIDVAVYLNADKKFYIIEDGSPLEDYNGITESAKYLGTYKFTVKAGSSYKVYCAGSKLGFFGFKYVYDDGTGQGQGGEETPSGYDLNNDGKVNILDVVFLIDYILNHMGQE